MTLPLVDAGTRTIPATERDDGVRCAGCQAVVTKSALGVDQAGAHQHTFRNPAGYSWTIRLFRDAAGCVSMGGLTAEASWFTGYLWCYAHCGGCGRHLGWWFVGPRRPPPPFVGLIVSRIA